MDAELRNFIRTAAQGEETPASARDPRWRETEALARKLIERTEAEPALKALEPEPAARKRWPLLLLTGLLRQGLGDREASLAALEVVADKLIAAADRDSVLLVLPRFLEPEPVTAAVRLLHFLARTAADDPDRIDRLRAAIAIRASDPDLHAELAAALERSGAPEAAEHRLRSIELRFGVGRIDGVADDLLRAVEEDLEPAAPRVGAMLLRFAALAPWDEAEPLLELALPALEAGAGGRLAWEGIESAGVHAPATAAARTLLGRVLRIALAGEPDPDAMVSGSGILNLSEPMVAVGARLARIRTFPPGAHASHATWGLGRVTGNDGDSLTVEFPERAGHRMSLAMAEKSLLRVPSDGLRVLRELDPARCRALVRDRDPEVFVAALRDLGGAATVAQLKPFLERALEGAEWSAWWRDVREALKGDARIDTREAYRQVYRLSSPGGEGGAGAALPELSARAAREGVGLLRKFLREHPEEEPRLAAHAGGFAARWARDGDLDVPLRAQALGYAATWRTLPEEDIREAMDDLIVHGLRPDDLPLAQGQEQLLAMAIGLPREETFLWRAVESRLPRLRERGLARLRSLLGEALAPAVDRRLARPTETPEAALRLVEHFAARPEGRDAPPASRLITAAIRLLEGDLPESSSDVLIALLGEGGALRTLASARTLQAEELEALERAVIHWAGSERRLVPVLDFLRAAGHGAIAAAYEERRSARAQSLLEGRSLADVETRHVLITRATCQRLEAELTRLNLELRTTIPAAIDQARQLGDLRENAEYEAAKLRQANAAARVQELLQLLSSARILETVEIDATRAGAGTEVELLPEDGEGAPALRFWILGEGDGAHGPDVVSYRAPIVRALLGKASGTEVTLETSGGPRRYRIVSIRRRLPGDVPAGAA